MIPYASADFQLNTGTLDIFFAGCSLACEGCHNRELWYSGGNRREGLLDLIDNSLVKVVRLMGGEPTEQPYLLDLMKAIYGKKVVWLFTGHSIVHEDYLPYCDYVKLGAYERNMAPYKIPELNLELASSNQFVLEVKTGKEYRHGE